MVSLDEELHACIDPFGRSRISAGLVVGGRALWYGRRRRGRFRIGR